MREKNYREYIHEAKIPILVLDQKWHQLFRLNGKPDEIVEQEQVLNDLLREQARLKQEEKDLRKLKNTLMDNIVQNMDGTHEDKVDDINRKKLDEDRRLIDDINTQLEEKQDRILELPKIVKDCNDELMNMTVAYCYKTFRSNAVEIDEITKWIAQVRHDLKVNVVKKQNREINSKQMYSYMHDVFGAKVVDIFDIENNDVDLSKKEEKKESE